MEISTVFYEEPYAGFSYGRFESRLYVCVHAEDFRQPLTSEDFRKFLVLVLHVYYRCSKRSDYNRRKTEFFVYLQSKTRPRRGRMIPSNFNLVLDISERVLTCDFVLSTWRQLQASDIMPLDLPWKICSPRGNLARVRLAYATHHTSLTYHAKFRVIICLSQLT